MMNRTGLIDNTKVVEGKMVANRASARRFQIEKETQFAEMESENFTHSSSSAWCRVECYERQHLMGSFQMDRAVIRVNGTRPTCDENTISFTSFQSPLQDSRVENIRRHIGKGVQIHQDEKQNLWATRLTRNRIYVRGHTLSPELVTLNGELTQGVPMKVFDVCAYKKEMKKEIEKFGTGYEVRKNLFEKLKVRFSFITNTDINEKTPCWFETWLLKVWESVMRYLVTYRMYNKQKGDLKVRPAAPFPLIKQKSHQIIIPPTLVNQSELRRTKSDNDRNTNGSKRRSELSTRCLRKGPPEIKESTKTVADEKTNIDGITGTAMETPEIMTPNNIKTDVDNNGSPSLSDNGNISPSVGLSYRQLFDIKPTDYFLDVMPPNESRHIHCDCCDDYSLRKYLPKDDKRGLKMNVKAKHWFKEVKRLL